MSNAPHKDRVAALREAFAAEGIDGFIIPRADEYQGEYVPDSADRLRWISGFTGSATVLLLRHGAHDGHGVLNGEVGAGDPFDGGWHA